MKNDVKNNININIIEGLISLGLTRDEASVYTALISLQSGSVLSIARTAGVKRPTAYHLLKKLAEKRLIKESNFRGVKDYELLPIERVRSYIHYQQQKVDAHINHLQHLYAQRTQKQPLRWYQGRAGIKTLLEKVLREHSILKIIGDRNTLEQELGVYWRYFTHRAQKNNLSILWKHRGGNEALFLWSDKIAFVLTGDFAQAIAVKNTNLHKLYTSIWKNYSSTLV